MNRYRKIIGLVAVILVMPGIIHSTAETNQGDAEQGLEEIRLLLEMTEANEEKDGMSLEEMTDAFSSAAMSEYLDSATGFSMLYPSIFLFDEELPGNTAATADGKATMSIDHMENQGNLEEDALKDAIRLEIPNADIQKNEQNGCLRIDRIADGGKTGQTDLYLLTKHSFHHIVIRYPAAEQETFLTYIEYMINTMGTNETDLG